MRLSESQLDWDEPKYNVTNLNVLFGPLVKDGQIGIVADGVDKA